MNEAAKPGSPRLVTAILTLVVAGFAFVTFGRGYEFRWQYPYLSLQDPAQAIFLWAEGERRVAMAWPGAPTGVATLEEANEVWKRLGEELTRAGGEFSHAKASPEIVAIGARVVAAGWGEPEALAAVRDTDEASLPEYLAERIRQIKRGDVEEDRARGRVALGFHGTLLALESSALVVMLAAGVVLGRRGRATLPESATHPIVVFGLPQAWVILSWAFAALALTWRFYYAEVPVLSDIGSTLPSLVLALVGLVLVRDTRASDSPAPLRRMFSIPKEFGGNGRWIVVAVGAFGASTLFERLSDRALGSLGVNVSASEFLVEPLLHGSTFVMLATVLELVVFAPLGEELLFRGVLFGALTSKLTTHRAALLSGVLFAVWHGYGIAGTVVVGFDGYLLARLYARTGSLLPGMLAHGLLNAAVSLYSLGCRF